MSVIAEDRPTIHATAVLVGARAVLIRGAPGAGKSILALRLIQAAEAGAIPFARLVGDDRIHAEAVNGRLMLRPAPALAGLLEIRGLGVRSVPFEAAAVAGGVVDLVDGTVPRLPEAGEQQAIIAGVRLPRLAVAHGTEALPIVLLFSQQWWRCGR